MAAPFLTRLESCRDSQVLWPLVAGLSALAHGALLLSLQPWVKVTAPPEPPSSIPVQLLPLTANPGASPNLAPASTLTPAPATPLQPEGSPSLAPTPSLTATTLAPESPPPSAPPTSTPPTSAPPTSASQETPPSRDTPSAVSPPPTVTPSPTPATPPTVAPPPVTPSVAAPPPVVTPPPTAPTPPAATPMPAAPSLPQGQLVPQGLRPTPYGRDWPDTPPQLLSTASIALAPWLVGCGVADLGAIASPGTTVHIPLRVRVEADGTVSAAYVDSSSGYPALDNLVSCIGQRQLRLAPALVDGQPHVTDAYQVDIQVQL